MTHHSSPNALRATLLGLTLLAASASTVRAQAGTPPRPQPTARPDSTGVSTVRQPNAVVAPAAPGVRAPVAFEPLRPPPGRPRPAGPLPPDPSAPVAAARTVVEPAAAVAAAPSAVLAPSAPLVIVNISTPPAGATARCKDGSYVTGAPSESRCSDKGGLGVLLPAPREAQAVPRP